MKVRGDVRRYENAPLLGSKTKEKERKETKKGKNKGEKA